MYIEWIVIDADGTGFTGGFKTREEAEAFAAEYGGMVDYHGWC